MLVNGRAFATSGPKKFLGSVKLLAATTDKVPGLKKAVSAALRGAERLVEAFGGESALLKGLGGHPETHILGETFFSQAPMLFGPYMVKVCIAPVSPELTELTDAPLNVNGKPNGLRDAVLEFFAHTPRPSGNCGSSSAPIWPRCRSRMRRCHGRKRPARMLR